MRKTIITLVTSLLCALGMSAQLPEHVAWDARVDSVAPGRGTVVLTATMADGWHIYGFDKPAEDARYFTLQGGATSLIVTMNARELRHFFSLRCCNRAQWEIRELARRMMAECSVVAPALFENAGPGCLRGPCPEGKRSCGKPMKIAEKSV